MGIEGGASQQSRRVRIPGFHVSIESLGIEASAQLRLSEPLVYAFWEGFGGCNLGA